jgi:hypothetical protein
MADNGCFVCCYRISGRLVYGAVSFVSRNAKGKGLQNKEFRTEYWVLEGLLGSFFGSGESAIGSGIADLPRCLTCRSSCQIQGEGTGPYKRAVNFELF